ncbi:MAG: protein-L-isoaspartate O-methyltransferase [Gammaproteobacteria bacterium]|nr:protein-L-isoaspartate O-methyltransferase [Gammaproteobacteria bacterium]
MSSASIAKTNMIKQQIRPWEVLDHRVLAALETLDREDFVGDDYRGLAYADCQIPLEHGARMLPPTVEGRMLQALAVGEADRALEIGCASGFVTACLARLAERVTSQDTRAGVIEQARQNIASQGIDNVEFRQAELDDIEQAPTWDVIAISGSLAAVPARAREALRVGGRLFVIVGQPPVMEALLITRVGDDEWTTRSLFETNLPRLAG